MRLGDVAAKVRSKNAGPFWITIDIFCEAPEAFARVSNGLSTDAVAAAFQAPAASVLRFDIAALNVIKFSLPRPQIQGTRLDRDMHGASFATLISDIAIRPKGG